MREAKASWVRALRGLTGIESDDIRWNEVLGRWEFLLGSADGISRSQFWGHFDQPIDPLTGLHPFRELDDHCMIEALANLQKTFVGNAYDGAGSTQAEVIRRHKFNNAHDKKRWKDGGQAFADMTCDTGGYGQRLRGSMLVHSTGTPIQRAHRKETDSAA